MFNGNFPFPIVRFAPNLLQYVEKRDELIATRGRWTKKSWDEGSSLFNIPQIDKSSKISENKTDSSLNQNKIFYQNQKDSKFKIILEWFHNDSWKGFKEVLKDFKEVLRDSKVLKDFRIYFKTEMKNFINCEMLFQC